MIWSEREQTYVARVLTVKNFRRWLLTHQPEEVVGQRIEVRGCPIALFLSSETGEQIEVHPTVWCDVWEEMPPRRLGKWAIGFTRVIDKQPRDLDENDPYRTMVRQSEALRVLDAVSR
jgi:hypothetical protein